MGAAMEEIIEVEAKAEVEFEATMPAGIGSEAALFLWARFLKAAAKDEADADVDVVVIVVDVDRGGGGGAGGALAVNKLHF